jgi:hypothetical protein
MMQQLICHDAATNTARQVLQGRMSCRASVCGELFISSANVALFPQLGKFPPQNRRFPFAYYAKLLNFASRKLKNREIEKV